MDGAVEGLVILSEPQKRRSLDSPCANASFSNKYYKINQILCRIQKKDLSLLVLKCISSFGYTLCGHVSLHKCIYQAVARVYLNTCPCKIRFLQNAEARFPVNLGKKSLSSRVLYIAYTVNKFGKTSITQRFYPLL